MSLSIATPNAESGKREQTTTTSDDLSAGERVNMEIEVEDEEEEDVDFNPYLRGETPSEASSSLSSENEGPGENSEKNPSSHAKISSVSSRPADETHGWCGDSKNFEEMVLQTTIPSEEAYRRDGVSGKLKHFMSSIQQVDRVTSLEVGGKEFSSDNGTNTISHLTKEELQGHTVNQTNLPKSVIEVDNEDAICRRTRAHHSLANYTLEELETFLQESDDDDDLHNIDDQEEYRKFLAAVLLGGDDKGQADEEDITFDEDEENDADFEIEIEEALESDGDENVEKNRLDHEQEEDVHMPETRQKKRLKQSDKSKKYLLEQVTMRPLVPYAAHTQISPFPTFAWQFSSLKSLSHWSSSFLGSDPSIGFTADQIAELYCLIHEHVQLLIQIFSVCVLDYSKQHISDEVQKMILEMIRRREEALACKKFPYPGYCFQPSNLHSSLDFDFHKKAGCSQWKPLIDDSVRSILDVAPLRLVESYITDVSDIVSRHRQRQVVAVADKCHWIKEPLFPLPTVAFLSGTDNDIQGGVTNISPQVIPPVSPGQQQPKKSLAATLVESTKKQSVALVPREIAKSAERFYPLFNSALFPHKPPPPAAANRVLFTDAEDGLLALGLMQYNTDWAAIQQHFLPCKSKHQIFVRQKNRSSSKAPDNPIKAVRRMKTSPLTADEMACINEGIKLFKHDWLSICKFYVPHRDPSLLLRQWRTANGTQKSYKKSDAHKAKRRLYEAKRRKVKALMADCKTSSGKEVDNEVESNAGDMDGEDESYVHEAFLGDSELESSRSMRYEIPLSRSNLELTNSAPYKNSHISDCCDSVTNECGESQQESGTMHKLLNFSKTLKDMHPSNFSRVGYGSSLPSNTILRSSAGQLIEQPFQTCKSKGVQIVKLAPDLPPVNLPPSVRVISQSTFKNYHCDSSYSGNGDNAVKNLFPRFSQLAKSGSGIKVPAEHTHKFSDDDLETSCGQDRGSIEHQITSEDNTSESDLHMHPLLFQASEDQLSYLSTNCHTAASSTYNFFLGNPLQAEPHLIRAQNSFRSMDPANTTSHSQEEPSNLCTIDFHPLLQRTDNNDSDMVSSVARLSGGVPSRSSCDKFLNPSDCNLRVPLADSNGGRVTGTASISPYEKESKLDLNICLCSATDKGKTKGRGMNEHHNVEATLLKLGNRMAEKERSADIPFFNFKEKFSGDSVAKASSSQPVAFPRKEVHSVVLPLSSGGSFQWTGDSHDESMPDIVMEQEELSDSEEEIEHVEFECEEIDDSEGEDLGSEQPTFQNEDILVFASNKEDIQCTRDLQQPHESRPAQKSSKKGKNSAGFMQASEDPCHAKLSRIKPKREPLKKKGSSNSLNMPASDLSQSSKKRNVASSKPQPQLMAQSKSKTFRKARKPS